MMSAAPTDSRGPNFAARYAFRCVMMTEALIDTRALDSRALPGSRRAMTVGSLDLRAAPMEALPPDARSCARWASPGAGPRHGLNPVPDLTDSLRGRYCG